MPKNKGKGGKNRRRGKNENDNEKRELTFKEEGQEQKSRSTAQRLQPRKSLDPTNPSSLAEYAQVLKMLGNGRLEALCFDGSKRLAHIRGKLRKKVWINQGDIILLSLRDYQDEKGDVILKYSADEARSLKAYGELPESAKINETDTYGQEGDGDCNFEFDEDRDSSDDDEDGGKNKDIDVDEI
ncbi:Eukaryotic translation initiation factor 1A [Phlyctema vagabunda]|uniref:Eukaryotic translation initiation factor 4C n=1 Tax=Phlyctema vagabunda TaxID=108571 RepID=A0ABR4PG46_9HELO